ncbi:MAG: GntR family transcriptional regulator [Ignavibacteriales bacterium]|nr:GntR family transcriptional regulator [Ignavibacteriales bacterium]
MISPSSKIDFRLEEVKPLRDRIVASIRDSIIAGKIKPGERLLEPDVAKMLGVSRTPLREAFLQLEAEDFVRVTPRRGAVVSDLSVKDAEEIYVVKSALEALAAKLASALMKDETLDKLVAINEQMEKKAKAKEPDYRSLLDLNSSFHRVIVETVQNDKLTQIVNHLRNQTLRYNFIYLSVLSHLEESIHEHAQIIEALRNRDGAAVEGLMKNHGENAQRSLCEYINNQTLAKESV